MMGKLKIVGAVVLLAAFVPLAALAQMAANTDSDAAALSLADQAPGKAATARDWHLFMEGAAGESTARNGSANAQFQRLSMDVEIDTSLAKEWRLMFSDQLDVRWQGQLSDKNSVNTLKEAYLSWQPQADRALDLGSINARYGVALGYNPTDFFRSGANRSIVSVDPNSLKKNREGSVMLRAQTLWSDGSLTALLSPKLDDHPARSIFGQGLGTTNNANRWMLVVSQKLSDTLTPQCLLYGEAGSSTQLGCNLTNLFNEATVAYVEWSGGRSRSQLSQALSLADDTAFRSRLAAGLTYTTTNKISLTAEAEFNGTALDQVGWDHLKNGSPATYGQYRLWTQNKLDLPTKKSVFFYANWQDALRNHLDINAMLRLNVDDHSRLQWLEARYHFDRADLALQWQVNSGESRSEFGALQQRQTAQALLRYFF